MEFYSVPVMYIIVFTAVGIGVFIGFIFFDKPPQTIQGPTITTTSTQTQFSQVTTTETQTTTSVSVSTATHTVNSTTTATSLTTITATRTLGTGITVTDYKLFETNVQRDSVLKLNLTINFASDYPASVVEQAIVILMPTNGNAADIKFVPNPIITQSSGLTLTLSMFTIIDHQIVAGTYMIEYAISTSQGSALVFTVLEIT